MRRQARTAFTYSNIVATLCLFIVLGGGAYAAKSDLISGRQLKSRSISGAKLKPDTLTGRQIRESTLRRVPDAAKLGGRPASAYLAADAAAVDAAKLGGRPAGDYLAASRVVQGSGATSAVPAETVLTYVPLEVRVETDGDADEAGSIRVRNLSSSVTLDVSLPTSDSVFYLAPGEAPVFVLPSGTQVTQLVMRQARGGNPRVGLSLTCGFDFRPGIVNCAGIGIG
jgi:hypothetical protein